MEFDQLGAWSRKEDVLALHAYQVAQALLQILFPRLLYAWAAALTALEASPMSLADNDRQPPGVTWVSHPRVFLSTAPTARQMGLECVLLG